MSMRDYAAGKMGMRDFAAAGKELMISSTTLGRRRGRGVQEEYEKLQGIVRETKVILMDLEWRNLHDEGNDEVREWLEKTTKLYCEADDMLDELSYEAMRIIQLEREEEIQKYYCMTTRKVCIDSLPLLLFCPRMSRKIKDFQHVLDELKQKLKMKFPDSRVVKNHGIHEVGLSLTTIDIDYAFEQVYKIDVDKTDQVFGREEDKTKIVNILLMDHHPNNINEQQKLLVIPIIGAPDAGKKTVAKLIFDDETIKSHFDLRFWVYARSKGYEFEVKRVVKEIVEQSPRRRSMGDLTNWDNLQHMLEEILSGKRFLLVLTDVCLWSRDKERWNNLKTLLIVGSKGSTIIVTTQFQSDASIMGTVPSYELGKLSLEASWELFRRKAFAFGSRGGALESADLVSIGRELVQVCGGFPLALTNLGAMMCFKENTEEWKAVLNTMRARSFYSIQKTNVLKICYDDMESPLKRCFAYCSVFPKNFIIEKKKLIQLWMAQGFLEQEASSSSSLLFNNGGGDHDGVILMEDKGNAYFKSLVMRSFLRVVKMDDKGEPLECRMEDGLHDFALGYVDTGPYSGTYYLSHLVRDEFSSIPGIFFSMTNQVRTLLDCPNDISSYAKSIKFYKTLRVLELRHVKKDELPLSIGELIHLRYLDLSHGRFKSLPASISKLYHLQTLKMLHCRFLQRLPEGMTKLINLRHLEIESSLITPRGFGRLSNIQTFTIFKVGNSVTEAGIEELRCLEQLGGRLSLIGLNNVKNGADAEAANLKEKRRLQELTLEWESDWHVCTEEDSKKQEVVLEELRPHPNLFLLRILRFSGTKLPTWLNNRNSHLLNLRELCIYSCHHVMSLDMTDLRSLQKLMISYCENMEHAGVEGLMHLELLEFRGCDKLKSLGVKKGTNQEEHQVGSSRDKHVHNILNLRSPLKVRIESCDRLTTLPEKLLQSLKTLHIENCANRMVLTNGLENLSLLLHLQIENCPNLKELSKGVGYLSSLQHFVIRECPKLMFLSEEMQYWTSLQTLSVVACANLRDLPKGITKLTSLQELEINGCDFLVSLPEEMQQMKSLQLLKIERCSHLRALPASLGNLSLLQVLEISSCNSLMSLPGEMQNLKSLDRLKIQSCDNLILPEEKGNPYTLRVLAIIGCPNLEVLPGDLGNLQNLRLLEITDCSSLTSLPRGLGELSSLGSLYIQRCLNLTSFPDTLPHMTSLRVLWLIECPKLEVLSSGLRSLSALEKLTIWGCHKLIKLFPGEDFLGIQALNSLQELIISNCSKLQTLPYGLENLPSLKVLVIWNCPELESFENVMLHLKERKLQKLNIEHCPHLEIIDDAS